jgi:hypothetical protein
MRLLVGVTLAGLRSSVRTQTWCYAGADIVYFFIAVRYVYITWKVQRTIRLEDLEANLGLRRAVRGFVGACHAVCPRPPPAPVAAPAVFPALPPLLLNLLLPLRRLRRPVRLPVCRQ